MEKIFRVKPGKFEIGVMTYTLPGNMIECDNYLLGSYKGFTGRKISISHAEPEYLTEEFEYKFMASEFGILMEEVRQDLDMEVRKSKIHNDIMPDITNQLTIADVDRFLFDHPSEPGIEAILVKHGYIKKVVPDDYRQVIPEPGLVKAADSLPCGADDLDSTELETELTTVINTADLAPEIPVKPLVKSDSPFAKKPVKTL